MPKKTTAEKPTSESTEHSPKEETATEATVALNPNLLAEGIKEAFVWVSPERVYKPKDLNWILNSILVLLLILAVLLFIREFILIAVVLAIMFLIYVLSTVPPRDILHKITNQGVIAGNHSYIWAELDEFWLDVKHGENLLIFETNLRFPRRLILLLGEIDPEDLKHYLVNYLPYREKPVQNWVEDLTNKVEKKLSL